MSAPVLLIMAGGTGGHIMPGLAVAHDMQARGWEVVWLGHPDRMEGRLVPEHGIALQALHFSGLRGKGILALLRLPVLLLRACLQANRVLRRLRPAVVLGMGGYVAFPGGIVACLRRVPLIIHEQNAIAGTANRWLARCATKVLTGFPGALPRAVVVGNPVRDALMHMSPPTQRYTEREGPLRILVVGGSLGAHVLNTVVPSALALLPAVERPTVHHQSGAQHLADLLSAYEAAGVDARCTAFIDDMAEALTWADLVICRAGAMTVAEIAVVGVAALFIPLPHAIDDHQTANARYLGDCEGAWVQKQTEFTPEWLAQWLRECDRAACAKVAQHARQHARPEATQQLAQACLQAAGGRI